jgi:DNA-directed RNA polymerase specialized sigma24 family protein
VTETSREWAAVVAAAHALSAYWWRPSLVPPTDGARAIDAADLAQDALVSVLAGLAGRKRRGGHDDNNHDNHDRDRNDNQTPSRALVALAVKRRQIDLLRAYGATTRRKVHRPIRNDFVSVDDGVGENDADWDERLGDGRAVSIADAAAEEAYATCETWCDVRAALVALPHREREAVWAVAIGTPVTEVAARWGVSPTRVSQVLSAARRRLAAALAGSPNGAPNVNATPSHANDRRRHRR